jgi:predicted amidophosphoribosyltransferase
MDDAFTYCVNCTAEIAADAETCPECGAEQGSDKRAGAGMATPPPAGWQAARPPASPTGFSVEGP